VLPGSGSTHACFPVYLQEFIVILVEHVVGNRNDAPWPERLAAAQVDLLALDQWEAQKNRLRKTSQGGVELAISLDRGVFLRNDDVLVWDEAKGLAIVARITLKDVMVIQMDTLLAKDVETLVRTAVELGHAIGNQHWPAVVKGTKVFVPLTVDRKVMASVMRTHAFQDVTYDFVPGSDVIPYLAPHEARRLFGGAQGAVHSHVQVE
jgi:urease accessory protein